MTTHEAGSLAESLAAAHLERLGYRILDRNYRIRSGELDLVADLEGVLCFVEVRSRRSSEHGTPLETISRTKRRRIAQAAEHYLATRAPARAQGPCRFDVVSIEGDPGTITVIQDAFRLEDC